MATATATAIDGATLAIAEAIADSSPQSAPKRVSEGARGWDTRSCEDSPLLGQNCRHLGKREEFESLPGGA
jgi:hypothetical protein